MVLMHGKNYCSWGVDIPFTGRFFILSPLMVAITFATMIASSFGLFFAFVKLMERSE